MNEPKFKSRRTTTQSAEQIETTENSETRSASYEQAAAALDTFVIPDNSDAYKDPDAPVDLDADGEPLQQENAAVERIDKAAFFVTIKTVLQVPSMMDADFAPIAIQQGETEGARMASDSIFELLEIWYPSALQPNSDTIAHMMIAGPFLIGKLMIARQILGNKARERRAKLVNAQAVEKPRKTETAAPPPANTDAPPEEFLQMIGEL